MKWLFVLAITGLSAGVNYTSFRVKFGWSGALANKEYFYSIPREVSQAEREGWRRVDRPKGPIPELRLYCRPDDVSVCPLYDQGGFVAGLQVAVPADDLQNVPYDTAKKFARWNIQTISGAKEDYWASTLYFVSEDYLKSGTAPRAESGSTLQDNGLWAFKPDVPGNLLHMPLQEKNLAKLHFNKENCIPNMGTHYYYNITNEMPCNDFFPWFALVKNGELVGAGFQTIGRTKKIGHRDWFEDPPARVVQIALPTAPSCLYDWASKYGVISLHVYFVEEPWKIMCENGDSLQPMSVVNRLLLNTSRLAGNVIAEAKSLISG